MRQGRGLRIATAGVRTGFAMTLTIIAAAFLYKKPRRVCRPQAAKIEIIFHRDMRVGENTSQTASVEFCRKRQNYARSRLHAFWQKKRSFFASYNIPVGKATAGIRTAAAKWWRHHKMV